MLEATPPMAFIATVMPDRSKVFYGETLGLQVSAEDDTHLYLRGLEERNHHCLILTRGETPVAERLGFESPSSVTIRALTFQRPLA